MGFNVRLYTDDVFGELTILVNDITGCWFVCKEICKSLKQKLTTNQLRSIVSPNNIMILRYINYVNDNEFSSSLWKKKNDHSDKILINKFGVLQIIHTIKTLNTNSLVEHFVGFTFKKAILSSLNNSQHHQPNTLSELDKQRLKLFSDNKFEVIEAHKMILKLELENSRRQQAVNNRQNDSQGNLSCKIDQEKMYEAIVCELTNANEEIERLKNQIGRGNDWSTVGFKKRDWRKRYGHSPDWKELCAISRSLNISPVKDCIEKDRKGVERKVNRYHKDVWNEYERREEARKNNMFNNSLPFDDK